MRRETLQNGLSSQRERLNKEKASKANYFNSFTSLDEAKEKVRFNSDIRRYKATSTNVFITEWQLGQ